MDRRLILRLLMFAFGLFVMTLGIAISTKADVGTTPISSIPFVINLASGVDFAIVTFIYNVLLVALQYVLLRKKFTVMHLIQLPVTLLFSLFTKITVEMVSFISPSSYLECWILIVLSVLILGTGVAIVVNSRTTMVPGEGAVLALSLRFAVPFSRMKIIFDVTNIVIAAAISLIFLGGLVGVREGTIFAALTIGLVVRYVSKIIQWLLPDPENHIS